jgi:hypothetical protein
MTIKLKGALGRCFACSVLGPLIAVAFVPTAMAQWMPPWGAPFPGEIARGLEAQGYVLTAPLIRRPGVYLADVSTGPAGHQRLIIDARSGQILEHFTAPGRYWGPALAARDEEFGDTQFGGAGPSLYRGVSGPAAPVAPMVSRGPANVHIPVAVGPYGVGEPRAGIKSKLKSAPTERKATINPPLPPPAPRETAKVDGSRSTAPQPTEAPEEPRMHSPAVETGSGSSAATAPAIQGPSTEASDTAKVSIVPPALFQ